jgi:hypothetical protein
VAFPLLDEPWLLELSPAVSLYVASRAVEVPGSEEPEDDTYAMAVPSASITFGREILRALSLGVQVKAGYLYFREDGGGRHLGFSEVGLSALLRL